MDGLPRMYLPECWHAWARLGKPGEDRSVASMALDDCFRSCDISLDLSGLGLTTLPDRWPAGIRALDISNNRLSNMGPLPDTLRTLQASCNDFSSLSWLPDTLDTADVSFSPACHLQEHLPHNIRLLISEPLYYPRPDEQVLMESDIGHCMARISTQQILQTMLRREARARNARRIPHQELWTAPQGRFPGGTAAIVSNTRLRNRHFPGMHHRFDAVPASAGAAAPRARACALDHAVTPWYPSRLSRSISALWSPFSSEQGAVPFGVLMRQLAVSMKVALSAAETRELTGGAQYIRDGALKTHVQRWLTDLAARPALRAATFSIAQASTASCSDSVLLTYNNMQAQRMLSAIDAGDHDPDLPVLVGNLRRLFRLQLLDELALNRMLARDRNGVRLRDLIGTRRVDEIEVYLGYRHALNHRLALDSMVADMHYFKFSNLTADDIDAAEKHVKREENRRFDTWLAVSDVWSGVLRRLDPARYRNMMACHHLVMEETDYYTGICAIRLAEMRLQRDECDDGMAADASAQVGVQVAADLKAAICGFYTGRFFDARGPAAAALLGAAWPTVSTQVPADGQRTTRGRR